MISKQCGILFVDKISIHILMIIGIGVDIVEINSFKEICINNKHFIQSVFTLKEIEYCESKSIKYQHFAARFAAKEAFMKAIGTGWDKGVQWKQIEIVHKEIRDTFSNCNNGEFETQSGKPEIKLNGKALEITKKIGGKDVFLSLSHDINQSLAFVIIEGVPLLKH
jgi:holo-[acyl-carrier protein] synthase